MSQFVTNELEDKVTSSRIAKHVVIKSILREHVPDIDESTINELLMKIHTLFYDSSMVNVLFSDIKEREAQKEKLQEMDLADLASIAFGDSASEEPTQVGDFTQLLEADEATFNSMMTLSEQIPYEEIYNKMKSAGIVVIVDFFSAYQGTTSSFWETTSGFSDIDKKQVIDIFSLFVEKQIEKPLSNGEDPDQIGTDLASSALSIDVADNPYSIFMYTPKKWLDKGQTHRLTIGLMIHEDWSKYISIMSSHIAKRLTEITEIVLGSTSEDLSNIPFRLVDLTIRKRLKSQIKEIAEFTVRCSLSWDLIQTSTSI